MYRLEHAIFDPGTSEDQELLQKAHIEHKRPLCDCTTPNPEMYIANVRGRYIVKRMPSSGVDHALECASFLPPEELSGLAQVQGSAIEELPDEGRTLLKLDFPLSIRGKRVAPPMADGADPTEAKAAPKKLTLTGLLHYFWYEADLVKWVPNMEGKRWWGPVHNAIRNAANNKIAKQQDISSKLFIPEPYRMDDKAAIAARRNATFQRIRQSGKSGTQLGILIAEYKSHEETAFGAKFTFKQMPDCPFFADHDLVKRFNRVFEPNLHLATMAENTHVIMIATFSSANAGYPVLQEIGMMLVNKNWIPFEHMRDHAVIETAIEQKRWFSKSMRFNLPKGSPIATMVITDINPPVALFVSAASDNNETITQMMSTAEDGTYDAWLWIDAEEPMPDLPYVGGK